MGQLGDGSREQSGNRSPQSAGAATPDELAAGLLAPSATHRLELGFEVMMRHKEKLHELVRIISDKLIDCGEECTDLW